MADEVIITPDDSSSGSGTTHESWSSSTTGGSGTSGSSTTSSITDDKFQLINICTGYCYTLSNITKKFEGDLFTYDPNIMTYATTYPTYTICDDGSAFYKFSYNHFDWNYSGNTGLLKQYQTYVMYGDQKKTFYFLKNDSSSGGDSGDTDTITLYIYVTYNVNQTEKTSEGYITGGILQYLGYSTNAAATESDSSWIDLETSNKQFYKNGTTRRLTYTIKNIPIKRLNKVATCSIWIKGYVCTASNQSEMGNTNAATIIYYINGSTISTTDTTAVGSTNSTSYVCHPKTSSNTMVLYFYFGTWGDTNKPSNIGI